MGTYGTATGIVLWFNPDTEQGELLNLVDGEPVLSLSGETMNLDGDLTVGGNIYVTGAIYWNSGKSYVNSSGIYVQKEIHMLDIVGAELGLHHIIDTITTPGNYRTLSTFTVNGRYLGINFYPEHRIILKLDSSTYATYSFGISEFDVDSSRITSLANPSSATDAVNLQTGDLRYGRRWRHWFVT